MKSHLTTSTGHSIRSRLLAFGLGVFFCLLTLEVALRLIGYFEMRRASTSTPSDTSAVRITCIGNSHTYGTGAPKGMGYPEQLEGLLNASSPIRYQIKNRGFPNANSSIIADNLPSWLKEDRPNIVFVMIGETNNWNKYGYLEYLHRMGRKENVMLFSVLEPFRSLRLYRLAELFLNRSESWNRTDHELFSTTFRSVRKDSDEGKRLLAYLWIGALETGYFKLKELAPEARIEALNMLRFLVRREPTNRVAVRMLADILWGSPNKVADFPEVLEAAIALHGDTFNYPLWRIFREIQVHRPHLLDDRLRSLMASVESRVSKKKLAAINAFFLSKGESATKQRMETMLEMIEYHPTHPITLLQLARIATETELPRVTRAIVRSIDLNPLTPSVYFINALRRRLAKRPELQALLKAQLQRNAREFGNRNPAKIFEDERIDEGWLIYDIERVIAASRSYGAKVVIQTYPPLRRAHTRPVDLILRRWWTGQKNRDDLELLDVTSQLGQIFARDGNKDRFYSMDMGHHDQHLNADGYSEIAKLMLPYVMRWQGAVK